MKTIAGDRFLDTSPVLCQIVSGESSCRFDLNQYIPVTTLNRSEFSHLKYGPETVFVPADSAVDELIQLIKEHGDWREPSINE
jgi:hypothetical protein